ncbi:hypothetical protein Ctob_008367 [Chrysochromulina tobinii]|uniref:Uncharacterized protein n=1 Tax=Chrysochromulina tobinii TaxID=1460289 RepID=A0A0M0JGG5_9EUKA|nr:hypothetical protein Ctob_008367 [Chrysochromulina tobinii]|eukprot:KOO25530.1 hypothetical protein Ctob_008367 [Chrysochromulina sp. CCMP291]
MRQEQLRSNPDDQWRPLDASITSAARPEESLKGTNKRHLLQRKLAIFDGVLGWNVTYFDAIISDAKAGIRKVTLTEENIVEAFRDAVTAELENTKEEQQLGAALHARRKKKELREQLKKQEA